MTPYLWPAISLLAIISWTVVLLRRRRARREDPSGPEDDEPYDDYYP
jgi:hypothetical protein